MSRVNLFLIGINKAGTSWLYHQLRQHPKIFMSDAKEIYFFGNEGNGPETVDTYHEYFPLNDPYDYFGDATPLYYRDPDVADQIHSYNPEAKILAIVRDPIQRLYSQYRYHKQLGILDENTSLETALDGRDEMLLSDSHYEETLPAFSNRFGSDQFRIVSLEEGRTAPDTLWKNLLSFLELPLAFFPSANSDPENPTGSAEFRRLYRYTVRPIKSHLPGLYRWMLQSPVVRSIKLKLIGLLGTADPEPIPKEVEDELRTEFAPTYRYLRRLGFDVYDAPATDATQ